MKSFRTALLGACALLAASCGSPSARIEGKIADAPEKEVVVKLLNVNTFSVLDTLKTDKSGAFSYKLDVNKGQPEFIYLYYGDTKLSSLLLKAGDKVTVESDTLGNSSVSGSQDCELLLSSEREYSDFLSNADAAQTTADYSKAYIKYYRQSVKFVMENKGSLAVVPVLFRNIAPDTPLFSQVTDALHFRSSLDTLKQLYPESVYVKSLENETVRREKQLSLNTQLSMAQEMEFPDIVSKDINGNAVKLSEVDAKAVFIHFWTVTDAASKVLNLDSLKPLYEKYHDKGFEIFAVSLDTDKAAWANIIKNQQLPWINVNDGLGSASSVVGLYNVTSLPQSYLLLNGKLYDKAINGDSELKKILDKNL